MGNSYSDINPFSSKRHIPKHLKPSKRKKQAKKPMDVKEDAKLSDEHKLKHAVVFQLPSAAAAADVNNTHNEDDSTSKISSEKERNEDEDDFEQAIVVGSGPRGAFRWFKGRRYINYAKEGGLENNLLPNDQTELDRLRVLSFIIKWAFKGYVIAPVEDDLCTGIKALNVSYGPGLWPGHHIIDMALDHPNSQFTAVDVLDLMPSDFEEESKDLQVDSDTVLRNNDKRETDCASSTLFTPIHPNLSTKLQNTTSPVVDSSTLDTNSSAYSNILLSRTDEGSTFDSSCTTTEAIVDDVTAKIGHLFINGVATPEVTPPPPPPPPQVVKRQLLKNLEFYQANVVDAGLPFPDNHFDFVKQQLVTSSFTLASWKKVMLELVRVTKPGGYIQLLEIDHSTFNLGPKGKQWETDLIETARLKRQIEPRMARQLPELLKSGGLIDVSSKFVSLPVGPWGSDLGVLWKHNLESFADSTAPLLSRAIGLSPSAYRRRWHELLEEVKERKAFSNMHAAWGRKSPTGTTDWSLCPALADNQ